MCFALRSPFALFPLLAVFAAPLASAADARLTEIYGKLPLQFEANRGQAHEEVRFLSRGPRYGLFLTSREAVLVLSKPGPGEKAIALRMGLVGAARKPLVSGSDELPGKMNSFIGKGPANWRTGIPTYAKVHYQDVYPGIDLVYYGNQRQLEYDFLVAPGADPNDIVLRFKGAQRIEIDAQGDLVLHAAGGDVRQRKPSIYQEVDGVRREIEGGYVLKPGKRVGFRMAAYDRGRPLVIDPVLAYSTYLGGNVFTEGLGIAVDAGGNAYVTGGAIPVFPTTAGAFDTSPNGDQDVFVTKLNPAGSALVYSTLIGGSGLDAARGIALDASGAVYVIGETQSSDFPTTPGAFVTTSTPGSNAFVAKLDATGSTLVYSTFLRGSNGADVGRGIAVDASGAAYVIGETNAPDFPTTTGAFQTVFAGGSLGDAFVTKLNAAGSALVYSTFLGGSGDDQGFGIAVDANGAAYVTGATRSSDFPTTPGGFRTSFGGLRDAFVAKLDATGSTLVYSTFLGGADDDIGQGIAVDATGAAYVSGGTRSVDFPATAGAFRTSLAGLGDAFVTKLNAAGSALVYSTFLGGSDEDGGGVLALDAAGAVYVTGNTASFDFPTTEGAFATINNRGDAYVTKLDANGSALAYSTFLGGSSFLDFPFAVAVDASGAAYLTGFTASTNFPTTPGAFDTQPRTGFRATPGFVSKLALGVVLLVIDKNGIDDRRAPDFFSELQVNDDVAAVGVRAQLRFFRDNVGQTLTLPSGVVGEEGWFALETIPASWAPAGGSAGFVGNPAANPEDPVPQGTGPGLGAPDASGDRQSLLGKVPDVTPLRTTGLSSLIGREVCAVVYDDQVGINFDQRTGNLKGATLGTAAFRVVSVTENAAPALPSVAVRIRDASQVCRGPFALLTSAEAPLEAPPPDSASTAAQP